MIKPNYVIGCFAVMFLIGFCFGILFTDNVEYEVEKEIDTGYKFVINIDSNDITEEQFKELSYQWVHYFDNQIFNVTSDEVTLENMTFEEYGEI